MTRASHQAASDGEVQQDPNRPVRAEAVLACVEVGGGGVQTVLLDSAGGATYVEEAVAPSGATLLVAVPGLVDGTRVVAAANLRWYDVDPAEALGLTATVSLLCNDAHAAALGEFALRDTTNYPSNGTDRDLDGLIYIGLGTGVGGAIITGGANAGVVSTEIGHTGPFGSRDCTCGRIGCLETVAGGWALPDPIDDEHARTLVRAVARAIDEEPAASPKLIVLGGGIARRYPDLVPLLGLAMPERQVESSAAPTGAKSAAAWGLRYAYLHSRGATSGHQQSQNRTDERSTRSA